MSRFNMSDSTEPTESTRSVVHPSNPDYRDYPRSEQGRYESEPSDARIQAQLGFMQEQFSITQKMFSQLTSQLEPILIPDMEDKDGPENAVPRQAASEISNTLDDMNAQVSRLQSRINRVAERLQL